MEHRAAYRQFTGDLSKAAAIYKKMADQWPEYKVINCLLASEFSRQVENEKEAEIYLNKAKEQLEKFLVAVSKNKDGSIDSEETLIKKGCYGLVVRKRIIDAYGVETINNDDLEKILPLLDALDVRHGQAMSYLLGLQLARCDQEESAEEFFHRCIRVDGVRPGLFSTLGGFELCKRLGQSREDDETYEGMTYRRN